MPRNQLTEDQKAAVRAGYAALGGKALATELGVPLYLVKNLVHREQLKRDPALSARRTIEDDEREYLERHYADQPTAELAKAMGRSEQAVYRMATKLGLKKSDAYLASEASGRMRKGDDRGARTRFATGHVSHNKGKKMPSEVYAKLQRTMFKKGQLPHNTKYDGYISVRRDNDGRQYLFIRVALGRHVHLHRHLWEQAHGPVPPGYVIAFKDGNQGNCVLENLEMITAAERMKRSTIHNYPPEIRNVMRLLGRLNRELKKHGTEQDAGPAEPPVRDDRAAAERRDEAGGGPGDQQRGAHAAGQRESGDQVHGDAGAEPGEHAVVGRAGELNPAEARVA